MSDMCHKCGGLIMEPNKAYGYAGKVCHCMWQAPYQVPSAYPYNPLTYEDIKRAVREVLNEKKND